MQRLLSFLLIALWVTTVPVNAAESYDYPFTNKYVATVIGVPPQYAAKLPRNIPLKDSSITIFKDRKVPDYLWYDAKLRYFYVPQKGPAPLVFLIAGTGASYNSTKNQDMARAFYQAGFSVVALSSPTYPNFIVAASKTSVPGHAYKDAEDLYRVMERIWDTLKDKLQVTDFYVTGYSLGAFNTAFVTLLDEQRQVFKFRKALLINPPVRLYSSISLLDRMLENIPGGVDNFPRFYNKLVEQVGKVYERSKSVEFDDEFLYQAFDAVNPNNEELAALIGVSFRISSANLVFTSDLMTNYGFVKPKNVFFTRNSSPGVYGQVSMRIGFTDYFHAYFYPFYHAQDPSLTREKLADEMSLTAIQDYLHKSKKIEVMTNRDDIILAPGQIDFFPRVFGDRAKIYPTGGHCGNMDYPDNVAYMVNVFRK
jgi:pimeloyl-ACP methyl ester carboxylesterase